MKVIARLLVFLCAVFMFAAAPPPQEVVDPFKAFPSQKMYLRLPKITNQWFKITFNKDGTYYYVSQQKAGKWADIKWRGKWTWDEKTKVLVLQEVHTKRNPATGRYAVRMYHKNDIFDGFDPDKQATTVQLTVSSESAR